MPLPEIEQFAELLIRVVRDEAIRQCDSDLTPKGASVIGRRWRAAMETGTLTGVREIIPDAVDATVCELLRAIDDGVLKVSFTAADGRTIDLTADGRGELVGWYMGTGSWRARYSQERFVDDLADLA